MASLATVLLAGALAGGALASQEQSADAPGVRFVTLEPGHFHAALVQKRMYPGVSPAVHVYARLGPDLLAHMGRVAAFNARPDDPTRWRLEVHAGPEPLERMLAERPGDVVVLSGRNSRKIEAILASVQAGLHVLADKPWILEPEDLPKLEEALRVADERELVAYDLMTERYEITSILQRELVNDPAVFGTALPGTPEEPGVYMESVHHLMKTVAGAPNLRPPWFFDTSQQGEGLNDVGTHLVDLAQWTLFPEKAIDYRQDVRVLSAYRWPTRIAEADFERVTGGSGFPEELHARVREGRLEYFCNTLVSYTLRGVHVTLNVIWDWEAPPGAGDRHYAYYRGSRARVEVRQTAADGHRPELYVVPNREGEGVREALEARVRRLADRYPGVAVEPRGSELRVAIPDAFRVGHEAHFGEVVAAFLSYLEDRSRLPAYVRPNMLAKYYVTTEGTRMSREAEVRVAPRRAP